MDLKTAIATAQTEAKMKSLKKDIMTPVPKVKHESATTAQDLKTILSGTVEQRMQETKSIIITMKYGERPEVQFIGFWNGRFVRNAMNAISRNYRLCRHKQIRAHADVPNKGE